MARPSCLDALSELHSPTSTEAQVAALKLLKNELIGHSEKKEELVRQGIVDALAHTLLSSEKSRGKRKDQGLNGAFEGHTAPSIGAGEDEERLQAILLLSSLAHGMSFRKPAYNSAESPANAHQRGLRSLLQSWLDRSFQSS